MKLSAILESRFEAALLNDTILTESFEAAHLSDPIAKSMAKYFPKKIWREIQSRTHCGVGGNGVRDSALGDTFDDVVNDVGTDYKTKEDFIKDFEDGAKKLQAAWPGLVDEFTKKIFEPSKKIDALMHAHLSKDSASETKLINAVKKLPFLKLTTSYGTDWLIKFFWSEKHKGFSPVVSSTPRDALDDEEWMSDVLKKTPEDVFADIMATFIISNEDGILFPMLNDFSITGKRAVIQYVKGQEITSKDLEF